MQLAILVTIVAVYGTAQHPLRWSCVPMRDGWYMTVIGALLVLLAAALIRLLAQLHRALDGYVSSRTVRFGTSLHLSVYVAYVAFLLLYVDYPHLIRTLAARLDLFLVDHLLYAAPLVIVQFFSWLAFWNLGEVPPPSFSWQDRWRSRLRYATELTRYYFIPPLMPLLALLVVNDFAETGLSSTRSWLFLPLQIGTLGLIVLFIPFVFRWSWSTTPLEPGEQRDMITRFLSEQRQRVTDVLIWQTHGRVSNAAVTGFTPFLRYLLITDGLMQRLELPELKAMVAHEVGHLRLGHLRHLAGSTGLLLALLLVSLRITETMTFHIGAVAMAIVVASWLPLHAFWMRMLEHEADLVACRFLATTTASESEPVSLYASALCRAVDGQGGADWLHPSVATRIAFLKEVTADAEAAQRFQLRVRMIHRGVWGLALILAVLCLAWA